MYAALNDQHPQVRSKCGEYLAQILIECAEDAAIDEYILELAGVISRNIADKVKIVRQAARKLFLAFERLWPQAANK